MWLKSDNKLLNLSGISLIEIVNENKIRLVIHNVEHHINNENKQLTEECFEAFYKLINQKNDVLNLGGVKQ